MKIAIVAPSPIPYSSGGAEKLWQGMFNYINRYTNHQCELIKIPIKEDNFYNLIDAYYKFYRLDLSHFYMVISGKYPAWMVKHPNHYLYMLHPLRGLYDLYDFKRFKDEKAPDFLKEITSIDEMFKKLFELKKQDIKIDFPSKVAKEIIHFLDLNAQKNIKKFFAISKTVALRENYFFTNQKIEVVYPPTDIENLHSNSYDYFFTVSRLDKPKRVDLIVKAYIKARVNIPLNIAGTGLEFKNIKSLTKDNPNIKLLGYISDKDLVDFYANALSTIFIPYKEDYGLVTIESMLSKKPVITTNNSGGVLEFVKDGKTGLVVNANIDELSKAIKTLADNKPLAKEMGINGFNLVKNITWQNCISHFIETLPKLTVVATYPIYPPRGGGQNRIYYLYRELAKEFEITVISLVHSSLTYAKKELAPNFFEIEIPKSKLHEEKEQILTKELGFATTDLAMLKYYELTPQFKEAIITNALESEAVILTNPYVYPLIKKYSKKPFIYESQNVEYLLKKEMMSVLSNEILKYLFKIEKECYLNSSLFTVCSKDDAKNFKKLYGKRDNIYFISNGVDLSSTPYFSKKRKNRLKAFLGFNKKIAIFMGSAHKPNIQAVEEIIKIAKDKPNIEFIILGGLKVAFENKKLPKNITFTGVVDNRTKERYLRVADIALNPMLTGSGTNLKMMDYLASGVATISTPIGARGLDISKGLIVVEDIANWNKFINNIEYYTNTIEAKRFVVNNYSWKKIAKDFVYILKKTICN